MIRRSQLLAVFLSLFAWSHRAAAQTRCDPPSDFKTPCFTPYDKKPVLTNRAEVSASLVRNYPPTLRAEGVGGRVTVWLLLDDSGAVRGRLVHQSSGSTELDEAALRVAGDMTFTPASWEGKARWVWIQIPIVFATYGKQPEK